MARVQTSSSKTNSNKNNKSNTPQKKVVPQKTGMKASPKKEPSKNEIMFFRIGMWAIGLTLVVVGIVLLVQHFMTEEEAVPYEDYMHVNVTVLKNIVKDNGDNTYGDIAYFDGKDEFADLRSVLNSNDVVYVYFYRSSDVNTDIKAAIEAVAGIDDMAFFFVDLDLADSASLFTTAELTFLNLDETKDNMLLIFDFDDTPVQLETRVSDILIEINKL